MNKALTEAQRAILRCGSFSGPRPGSNMWAWCEFDTPTCQVDGEEVDELIRLGLVTGAQSELPMELVPTFDDIAECVVDVDFDYTITPAGRARLEEDRP